MTSPDNTLPLLVFLMQDYKSPRAGQNVSIPTHRHDPERYMSLHH